MKKLGSPSLLVLTVSVFAIVTVTTSCKRGADEKVAFESVAQKPVNFHVQEVVADCGLPLIILDMKELGATTRHIF